MNKPYQSLKAAGAVALGSFLHGQATEAATIVPVQQEIIVNAQLYGAANTSTQKLGIGFNTLEAYANDLSSGTQSALNSGGSEDAGSWDNQYFIVHNGGGLVDKFDVSNPLFVSDSSSVNGTNVGAISSVFDYQGAPHFAAIDSSSNQIKYFKWGSETPVATGPSIGSDYTGLEAVVDGPVTDLSKIPLLVSRSNETWDQYHNGTIVGSYQPSSADSGRSLTDLTYNASSGILTLTYDFAPGFGAMTNLDFKSYVVPEPSQWAALFGGASLMAAAATRQRRNKRK